MKTEIITCDVCASKEDVKKEVIQVIFTTEQTEGRSVEPYLSIEEFDICKLCKCKVLQGKYIYGSGAQGYNKYWFKQCKFSASEYENTLCEKCGELESEHKKI